MVSLKKQPQQIREYTPEHLIDEETTIRQLDIRQKQPPAVQTRTNDRQDNSEKKEPIDKRDVQDFIEAIIKAVIFVAILVIIALVCGKSLAEGLQLAKDIAGV